VRYDAEHKEETRRRVLKAAAEAIRADGPSKVGVADVMARVGLTHGGFYAHFASKDDLVAQAVGEMFRQTAKRLGPTTEDPARDLAGYIDFYLSAEHRDARGQGCPLPYLSGDAPRMSEPAQAAFSAGAAGLAARLAGRLAALGWLEPEADAASLLAELVGALALARAEPDPRRSDAILAASRASLKRRFSLETVT
jgi:TetR/AcrR family transcriptional regulator, transcriptional repressor for nem operon